MGTNLLPQIISRNWYNTVITVRNYILGKPVFLSAKAWTEVMRGGYSTFHFIHIDGNFWSAKRDSCSLIS